MKLRMMTVAMVFAALFISAGTLYAANGDLIVNGNLTVSGTVNGNKIGHVEVFTSSGVWNTPANIQGAVILAVGGGGGGGRSVNGLVGPFWEAINGSGGGGGGEARWVQATPSPSTAYTVTVGAGGGGATVAYTAGGTGGDTSVGPFVTVKGGNGGGPGASYG